MMNKSRSQIKGTTRKAKRAKSVRSGDYTVLVADLRLRKASKQGVGRKSGSERTGSQGQTYTERVRTCRSVLTQDFDGNAQTRGDHDSFMHDIRDPCRAVIVQHITPIEHTPLSQTPTAHIPHTKTPGPGPNTRTQHRKHDEGVPDLALELGRGDSGSVLLDMRAVYPNATVQQDSEEDSRQGFGETQR